MNVPPACYSCGSRTTKVKTECCKMRKIPTGVDPKFQGWRDELALLHHGVQSVLEKRFTCVVNVSHANISHAQKIADLIHERS